MNLITPTIKTIASGIAICLLGFLPLHALAEWDGGIEGGTVLQDGGSATRLRLKLTNSSRPLSHFIYADWTRSDASSSSYEVGYQPRYWFGRSTYVFGDASVRQARPLNIDLETLVFGGIGIQLAASDETGFFAEAGIGQRSTEFTDTFQSTFTNAAGSDTTEETLTIARAGFYQVLADLVKFELDANVNSGDTVTQSTAEAGIAVRAIGGSIKVSYRLRRIDVEGLDTVEDTDTAVSFSYGF